MTRLEDAIFTQLGGGGCFDVYNRAHCTQCQRARSEIGVTGFASDDAQISLCVDCASDLVRILFQDIAVYATGMRMGENIYVHAKNRKQNVDEALKKHQE